MFGSVGCGGSRSIVDSAWSTKCIPSLTRPLAAQNYRPASIYFVNPLNLSWCGCEFDLNQATTGEIVTRGCWLRPHTMSTWINSGHSLRSRPCPLYSQTRTLVCYFTSSIFASRESRLRSSHPLVAGKRLTKSGPGQYRCSHPPLRGMFSKVIENYIHRLMDGNGLRRANSALRIKHVTHACNIPGAKIVKMSLVNRRNIANIEQFIACFEGGEVLGRTRGDPQKTRRKNKRH